MSERSKDDRPIKQFNDQNDKPELSPAKEPAEEADLDRPADSPDAGEMINVLKPRIFEPKGTGKPTGESETVPSDDIPNGSEKNEAILTPLKRSTDFMVDMAEKRASEEKIDRELGILTPGPRTSGERYTENDLGAQPPHTHETTENDILLSSGSKTEEIERVQKKDIPIDEVLEKGTLEEGTGKEEGTNEEDALKEINESIKDKAAARQDAEDEKPPSRFAFVEKIKALIEKEKEEIDPYDPQVHGPLSTFNGIQGYEEIDRYWLNEPYAFVVILYDPEINNYIYHVVEPELTYFENVFMAEIKDRLRNVLLVKNIGEDDDKEEVLDSNIRIIIKDYTIEVTSLMLEKISYYIKRDFARFTKIDPLMFDNSIEDISGNGHDSPIFLYHKTYQNIATNIIFGEDELDSFIIQLAQKSGKHISIAEPLVDATMPDGSRIQMTLGTSVTTHGSTFTIRKFSEVPITPVELIKWGTFSSESMAYLWLCIENNKSLIYAGGTASGKTSSLNAVSLFIPEMSKIISLEDTRELKLPHQNWIPGVTRDTFTADERGAVDMYDLLKAALRQRPEYLLVGEVRGKEALTLFQAMSTGHTTFSTMHADSVASAIHRLENPPISVPRNMIQALDIMSIQAQTYSHGKRVRRNLKLVEIIDIDPNTRNIRTNDIFVWDSNTDTFHRTGESKALVDIRMRRGWGPQDINRELKHRQQVLEYMINNNVTDFKEISTIINAYQATPEKLLKKLNLIE